MIDGIQLARGVQEVALPQFASVLAIIIFPTPICDRFLSQRFLLFYSSLGALAIVSNPAGQCRTHINLQVPVSGRSSCMGLCFCLGQYFLSSSQCSMRF